MLRSMLKLSNQGLALAGLIVLGLPALATADFYRYESERVAFTDDASGSRRATRTRPSRSPSRASTTTSERRASSSKTRRSSEADRTWRALSRESEAKAWCQREGRSRHPAAM